MNESRELKQRVFASIQGTPSPTRRQTFVERAWLVACGLAGALAVFVFKGGVRMTGRPPSLVALTSLGTATIAGLGMWALFTRGRSMLGRPRRSLVAAGLLASAGFLAWKYGVSALFGLNQPWPARIGLRCLLLGIMTGALPLWAALLAARRAAPLSPVATGAACGAGAGLGSATLVDLWCPVAYLPHLLLGHLLPIVVLALLGALFGSAILRRRRG